jgi:hypothetical protein
MTGSLSKKCLIGFVVFMIVLFFSAVSAQAQTKTFESKNYDVGLLIGPIMPGTISLWTDDWTRDVDTSLGFFFKGYADAYIVPKFAMGMYMHYVSTTLSYGDIDVAATMWEVGFSIKPRLILSPVVALKPGFNIGYRKTDRESLYAGDVTAANGMAINASLEFQYLMTNGYIFAVDGGFITQPVGGNSESHVTWAPIMYLSAGIVF